MNLRELAESDLKSTLTDAEFGGASEFAIVSPDGAEKTVSGTFGDVGYLLDADGNPIAGRQVVAAYRLSDFVNDDHDYVNVKRGWRVFYTDMAGHEWSFYVSRFEPDRTLGIGRLVLAIELAE